ncbi:hypothetical protein Henu3_gp49 [Mycobacterium phage Henu3]|uniref:Uncharacterized protein n=1 Tax=Mycobacterium phage Henu3 TaxID=2492961 RepID=A0A410T810_9CAUD|nr:hypothetical protein I5G68_gp46 [Mycobacterium phage Henu3]QAU04992.1 hypothetical protein Henu3_gp49 [Mycobacterium phage Henu3]
MSPVPGFIHMSASLLASYSRPARSSSFWLVPENERASSPMFLTVSVTTMNSPWASTVVNWLPVGSVTDFARSTLTTVNSNLPSRTELPAGAAVSLPAAAAASVGSDPAVVDGAHADRPIAAIAATAAESAVRDFIAGSNPLLVGCRPALYPSWTGRLGTGLGTPRRARCL